MDNAIACLFHRHMRWARFILATCQPIWIQVLGTRQTRWPSPAIALKARSTTPVCSKPNHGAPRGPHLDHKAPTSFRPARLEPIQSFRPASIFLKPRRRYLHARKKAAPRARSTCPQRPRSMTLHSIPEFGSLHIPSGNRPGLLRKSSEPDQSGKQSPDTIRSEVLSSWANGQ